MHGWNDPHGHWMIAPVNPRCRSTTSINHLGMVFLYFVRTSSHAKYLPYIKSAVCPVPIPMMRGGYRFITEPTAVPMRVPATVNQNCCNIQFDTIVPKSLWVLGLSRSPGWLSITNDPQVGIYMPNLYCAITCFNRKNLGKKHKLVSMILSSDGV